MRFWILTLTAMILCGSSALRAEVPDAQALADKIDGHIAARWKVENVEPAPLADDAEFLRRVSLDLTGRIPVARDVYEFLADNAPDKRRQVIDRLLASPRHAVHFATVWRAMLLPEVEASADARFFQPGFEAWLYQKWRSRVGYDQLVMELLTVPISSDGKSAQAVFEHPDRPNPLAFYAAKSALPENLAAATTRIFLGVQLECAQCHDHPFASWSRDQFWSQSAFFAGIKRQGSGLFDPLTEMPDRHELTPPESKEKLQATFLDNREPTWQAAVSPRVALAQWITSPDNRYFARATVNRRWGQLFGLGLVDPVDDFRDDRPASHPELLNDLAHEFVAAKFDVDFIVRAICLSRTYQLTSAGTDPSQQSPQFFGKMATKRLSGEQFFDSLAQATGFRDRSDRGPFNRDRNSPRERFLAQFAPQGKPNEPETSIIQALVLMNGKFLNDATTLGEGELFTAVSELPDWKITDRIEALYIATLGRKPTGSEIERLQRYIGKADKSQETQQLGDVFWMLLNSAEFRLNH